MTRGKKLKINSLVKFDFDSIPRSVHLKPKDYPFTSSGVYVFLGEIVQMPGHCIVINMTTGHTYCGYHTENFIALTEDEL